ncbi:MULTISPECIES: CGNR zinc finger domain-containing protein [Streptomyces]|uniref:CGNR zinc finger domain-containing protein n=1 Tax=Streptomyces TaxID=1883 RepID=UPI0035A8B0A0
MHRIRRCTVTECTTVLADTSRTGRQRYCSPPQCAKPRRSTSTPPGRHFDASASTAS